MILFSPHPTPLLPACKRRAAAAMLSVLSLAVGCAGPHASSAGGSAAAGAPAVSLPLAAPDQVVLNQAAPTQTGQCLESLRPAGPVPVPGQMPPGTTMAEIQKRGKLRVAVDQTKWLLGAYNPINGQIEGFDVELARQMAKAIFGDENKVELRAVTSAQRVDVVKNGEVDMVFDSLSVTCDRASQIHFSSPYFESSRRLLIRTDNQATKLEDLKDRSRVCASKGSTAAKTITEKYPKLRLVERADQTDCLVAFQTGEADGIYIDDVILAGLADQDPYAKIVGPRQVTDYYGVGIKLGQTDLVQFTNAVLERWRADGTWQRSYDKWLGRFNLEATQPQPRYK